MTAGCLNEKMKTTSDEIKYAPETRTTMDGYAQMQFNNMRGSEVTLEWTRIPNRTECTLNDDVVLQVHPSGRRVYSGQCPIGSCTHTEKLGETVGEIEVYALCKSKIKVTVS